MEITSDSERAFGQFVLRAHVSAMAARKCENNHSSRLIEHVCTKSDVITDQGLHIQSSYKQQLRIWGRRRFDMFSRPSVSPRLQDNMPTIAKMHFDLWALNIGLYETVSLHEGMLKQSMKEYRVSAKRLKVSKETKEDTQVTILPGNMSALVS